MIRIPKYFLLLLLIILWHKTLTAQTQLQRRIDSLNNILETSKEDTTKVNTLTALSDFFRMAGEKNKGRETAETALQLSDKLNYKAGRAFSLNLLGIFDLESGNLKDALDKFQICAAINVETGNVNNLAHNLNNIGNVHWYKGEYDEAVKNYKLSLKAYEQAHDTIGILRINNNIGETFHQQGNYPEALRYLLISLKFAQARGSKFLIALRHLNIGAVYMKMMNYPEAMKNFQACLINNQGAGSKIGIAQAYNALGEVYEKINNYNEALNNYSMALKIAIEIDNKDLIGSIYNNIGSACMRSSDYDRALTNFNLGMDIFQMIGSKQPLAVVYVNIGEILLKQSVLEKNREDRSKKYNEAIKSLNRGLLIATEIGAKETIKDAYKVLCEIYKESGDYTQALKYYELYSETKDSLMNNETTRKLEQQRTQYEVEKAVSEEKVQQEKALAAQKFKSEKELADKNANHQIELAEEKVQKEKAIEIEKLKYEFTLAEERTEQEKILAEQKFENEKKLAQENASHQQEIIEQKALQQKKDADANALLEKEKADRKRKNELMLIGFGAFLLISVFVALLIRQRNLKRRAVERAEAGHKMAELELQSLRAQLNPHFMFNSLNAIQDLIVNENNEKSHLYLSRFSKLLRMLLDNASQPFVTVKQELELLELYLSLENLRIPNLQYSIEKDPKLNAEERMIPNMMLQPYIENAIWHGLSNKKGERKLQIRIHENGTATEFEVEDNGIGRKRSAELKQQFRHGHHSKGMQLLSKRFELLSKEYGTAIQTTITDLENDGDAAGTLVKIDVPFNLSEQAKQLAKNEN